MKFQKWIVITYQIWKTPQFKNYYITMIKFMKYYPGYYVGLNFFEKAGKRDNERLPKND